MEHPNCPCFTALCWFSTEEGNGPRRWPLAMVSLHGGGSRLKPRSHPHASEIPEIQKDDKRQANSTLHGLSLPVLLTGSPKLLLLACLLNLAGPP